ncbi:MAG: Endo,4-beta-xylanase precursor [Gammaproteobacteria bacterium]|nr:Endo,4-beta-xylanase precursor [Gammaproteobacteria bacterium]
MDNLYRKKPAPAPLTRHSALALTAIALSLVTPAAFSQGAGYWHTSGNQILDSNDQVVRLAGVNWYGFETPDFLAHGLWAQDYKTILNTIKSNGYNVIRIPFSNQVVESNPIPTNFTKSANGVPANTALIGQTALADLDTLISYAGSIGLRVILDNHRSEAGSSNEANGLWYTSTYTQANWIADWQTLATRYSASQFTFNGNPTVVGMDLRNEPHSSGSSGSCWTGDTGTNGCPVTLTSQNWPVAAATAGDAVLAINPRLLVFVEGTDCYNGVCGWQGGNLIGVASHPVTLSVPHQLVYSAHDYGPNLFQQAWFNSSTTPASLSAIWGKYWGYISAGGIAPVWLGEFGTTNNNTDVESTAAGSQGQWFQALAGFLQATPAIQWTYWALNGEDSYGLLDNNYDQTPANALKQSLLAAIQSPLGGGGTATPGFTLAPSSSTVALAPGGNATDTITVADVGGFSGNVTLAVAGLPAGVTAAFATNPTSGSSLLTLTGSSTAAAGTFNLTVTGTSGALTSTTHFALTVSSAAGSGFACHVDYTLSSEWPGGFGAAITINNTGTTAISNWTLTWSFANGQTVTQLWNGNVTQSGANVSVTNESYNGNIASGGSYSGMGLNGTWNNTTNAVPTSFAVNAVACQ